MLERFESDYYAIHFFNILGVRDLPPYYPKTTMKFLKKVERNSIFFKWTYWKHLKFEPQCSLQNDLEVIIRDPFF